MEGVPADMYLLPPPRLAANDELPPHLGELRLATYEGRRPDEIEPFAAEPAEDEFTVERADLLVERALGHDLVRSRLEGVEWELIGAAQRRGKRKVRNVLVVAYDYTNDVAIEVTVDEEDESVDVTEASYQPPPTQAEIARAIELAHADERVARMDMAGLEAMTIPLDPPAAGEPGAGHRLLEVVFGRRGERLPDHRVVVDLSERRVLRVGLTDGCGCAREVRSEEEESS